MWSQDYNSDEQMRMFGTQFMQAAEESERIEYGTNNQSLLDSLPKTFTIKDVQKLKGTSTPKQTLYSIIRRWMANDLVHRRDSHTWVIS